MTDHPTPGLSVLARSAVEVIEFSQRLIQAPSPNPSGDERQVAGLLVSTLKEVGLPQAVSLELDSCRPNLSSTIDFGPGGKHLVLCGHMDTKPVGDAMWQTDPFVGVIDGDRLIGLGSADMKAAIAAMVVAAARVADSGLLTSGRLTLLFTADEEAGAKYGANYLAKIGAVKADAIVIGEPGGLTTDFDTLHLVSRGSARFRIVARGKQGHSSLSDEAGVDPALRNAGVAAARAVCAVAADASIEIPKNLQDLIGWRATLNPALAYRGGVGFGVLPGVISVDVEVRLLPGMDRGQLLRSISDAVAKVPTNGETTITVEFDTPPLDWLPPTIVDSDDSVVLAARSACKSVFGEAPPNSVFPGTTDATWFGGPGGIPTLPALGPGLLRRCHAADEWVSIAAVRQSVDLYAELVTRYCSNDLAVGADS